MLPALSGIALICLVGLMLTGCMATQAAPAVSAVPEPAKPSIQLDPPHWPLRLTRL
jgi:PBP1b-binding outer membrane lipoprotein LpoB